ncbi:ankyrin-3-like [Macrosteles quadrilineatus]|uniref:ankyrin-3-like n=1 Tax=Macrosteles quadrilineatus TaxID=74068 RepID=UPI0023E092B8|nr:ankyrin-3-like [Macrosteles quadrilineatus]
MASSHAFNQPLHRGLLSCNIPQLQLMADRFSLDMQFLVKTMYLLSDYLRQGRNITPLQGAIMIGNFRICKRLIAEGADFFSYSYDLLTPLNMALDVGKFQIAKLLITSGADVCVLQNGYFPMYFAIKSDTPEYIIEMIIRRGFPVNGVVENMYNSTALHRAVLCNNVDVTNLLLRYEADCNVIDNFEGYAPIHIAVKQKQPEIVKLLAEHGANLEVECGKGFTPIFYAAANNDVNCLNILLEFGAEPNHLSTVHYIYPLHHAASLCSVEATDMLLKRGADVQLSTPITRDLPIHSAVMSEKSKISEVFAQDLANVVKLLIENGSQIDVPNNYNQTPMELGIIGQTFEAVQVLVKEGAAVNKPLDCGTYFHFVASKGNKEIVTTFLEHGADYSFFDVNKITPYHTAAFNPDLTVLSVFWKFHCPVDLPLLGENSKKPLFSPAAIDLLENQKMFLSGVKSNDVNVMMDALSKGAEARGCSMKLSHPLHVAASKGYTQVVKLLLENGVAPSSVNSNNETPLHVAAKAGHYDVCRLLLKHGAVYNSRSKVKKTPLELATENNHEEVAHLLTGVDMIFKIGKEKKVSRKIKELSFLVNDDLYFVYVNSMNSRGETLLKVAIKKQFTKLTDRLMKLRVTRKDV